MRCSAFLHTCRATRTITHHLPPRSRRPTTGIPTAPSTYCVAQESAISKRLLTTSHTAPTAAADAAAPAAPKAPKEAKAPKEKKDGPPQKDVGKKDGADEKGLTYTKEGNFPKWYEQVRRRPRVGADASAGGVAEMQRSLSARRSALPRGPTLLTHHPFTAPTSAPARPRPALRD